jgi:hypothetical protein
MHTPQPVKTGAFLAQYAKQGNGNLVKIRKHKIVADFTVNEGICPNCKAEFGRAFLHKGKPVRNLVCLFINSNAGKVATPQSNSQALKVIGGSARVFTQR